MRRGVIRVQLVTLVRHTRSPELSAVWWECSNSISQLRVTRYTTSDGDAN